MNSFNKPQTHHINSNQILKNPNQIDKERERESNQFTKRSLVLENNLFSANSNKINDYQNINIDSIGNINKQFLNYEKNQGNLSNYFPNNENINYIHQVTNFYGPGFLRTPYSPEQIKTNINYINLYDNEISNIQSFYENNNNFQNNINNNNYNIKNVNMNLNTIKKNQFNLNTYKNHYDINE
jgi:hypothetical protein